MFISVLAHIPCHILGTQVLTLTIARWLRVDIEWTFSPQLGSACAFARRHLGVLSSTTQRGIGYLEQRGCLPDHRVWDDTMFERRNSTLIKVRSSRLSFRDTMYHLQTVRVSLQSLALRVITGYSCQMKMMRRIYLSGTCLRNHYETCAPALLVLESWCDGEICLAGELLSILILEGAVGYFRHRESVREERARVRDTSGHRNIVSSASAWAIQNCRRQ